MGNNLSNCDSWNSLSLVLFHQGRNLEPSVATGDDSSNTADSIILFSTIRASFNSYYWHQHQQWHEKSPRQIYSVALEIYFGLMNAKAFLTRGWLRNDKL